MCEVGQIDCGCGFCTLALVVAFRLTISFKLTMKGIKGKFAGK